MAKKEIKDMTLEEMRAEIKEFCMSRRTPCNDCPLSLNLKYGSRGSAFSHDCITEIMDYYKLALMLEIVRGNLIWKDQTVTTETVTTETVLKEARGVNELEVDDDSTGVVIIGKRPSMMTIYFTQPAD